MLQGDDSRQMRMATDRRYAFTIATTLVALAALWLLPPSPGLGQALANGEKASATARAKQIARIFEANARVLTVYDREGKIIGKFGDRAMYRDPVFSPDRTRVAVIKNELESESRNVWVLDVATGAGRRLTSHNPQEGVRTPVWSPDGSQVAYVATRAGKESVYRRASNGEGSEELLYQPLGAGVSLTDWSMDGRYLCILATDRWERTVSVLVLAGIGKGNAIEILRSASQVQEPHISPDCRLLSYVSNESGRNEIYVRAFDTSGATSAVVRWLVSDQGGESMAFWRRDGKELYYLAPDRAVMVVGVSTIPTFVAGRPMVLFHLPATFLLGGTASISRDGERIVGTLLPADPLRQITLFDRKGNLVSKVAEPGLYEQPALSPDGTRIVAMRDDLKTGQRDIWTFDVATGKSMPVTLTTSPENAPVWSPDGKQVAYASTRGTSAGIYRKAWDGSGNEEQLFQHKPGPGIVLTDWSADAKFMAFHSAGLMLLPLGGDHTGANRNAIDWLPVDRTALQGRFSPDMHYLAYLSSQDGPEKRQIYVRQFDANKPERVPWGPVIRVTHDGAIGMVCWRRDGKEMYFMQPDPKTSDVLVMAVDITTTPNFQAGNPRLLFKLPGPPVGNPEQLKSVRADGRQFVFAIPLPVGRVQP